MKTSDFNPAMQEQIRRQLTAKQHNSPQIGEHTFTPNEDHSLPPGPEPQPPIRNEPLGAHEGEKENSSRIQVRITSFRRRLLDPDNLAGGCKYFVDCCRYASLIPNDRAEDITLETRQVKVSKPEDERTEIEII